MDSSAPHSLTIYSNRYSELVKLLVEPAIISASITNEAAEELAIKVGEQAVAIIKASEVIVGKV